MTNKRITLIYLPLLLSYLSACGISSHHPDERAEMSFDSAERATLNRADPQMRRVLDAFFELNPKPIDSLTAPEARRQPSMADAVLQVAQEKGEVSPKMLPPVGKVESAAIPGPAGKIPLKIYSPKGKGPFPIIVYYHGGGWVLADPDVYDASARSLTSMVEAVVISVDYRRAPENKFPAAHEDSYAALQYVMKHPADFKGKPGLVAVAGESAGGNLATAVCQMAKERDGLMPLHQLLIYPITDYAFDTPSYMENGEAKPLNTAMMHWFFAQYLNSPADGENTLISPLRASPSTLAGLPPTTLITSGIDPLRSEGIEYGKKLKEAGVDVAAEDYPSVTHEFFGMGVFVGKAKEAEEFAAKRLKKAFSRAPQLRSDAEHSELHAHNSKNRLESSPAL